MPNPICFHVILKKICSHQIGSCGFHLFSMNKQSIYFNRRAAPSGSKSEKQLQAYLPWIRCHWVLREVTKVFLLPKDEMLYEGRSNFKTKICFLLVGIHSYIDRANNVGSFGMFSPKVSIKCAPQQGPVQAAMHMQL